MTGTVIPCQQSYGEPRWQECYERYLAGETQRQLAASLGLPLRTIGWRCVKDAWEAERKARRAAIESGDFASLAATVESDDAIEIVEESVDDMLRRQQRVAQMLSVALLADVERTLMAAEVSGKPLMRGQLVQLASVVNNIHSLERKAHRLPEKLETKDTTPTIPQRIRNSTDDELTQRERELDEQLAAAGGAETQAERGEGASGPRTPTPERVN